MGWNQGYSIYEEQVVGTYDTGELTPALLKAILVPFVDTDIDNGGCKDLTTNDGLSADEVVVKILRPSLWAEYSHKRNDEESDYYTLLWKIWDDIVVDGKYDEEVPV